MGLLAPLLGLVDHGDYGSSKMTITQLMTPWEMEQFEGCIHRLKMTIISTNPQTLARES